MNLTTLPVISQRVTVQFFLLASSFKKKCNLSAWSLVDSIHYEVMIRRYKILLQCWKTITSYWLWRLLAISFFNFINLTLYLIFRAWGKWCELEKTCAWPILVGGNRIISGNIKEQSYSLCCVCNLCITRWSPVVASKATYRKYKMTICVACMIF